MSEIVLDRIGKRFGAIQAVANLSLEIDDGSFVVLLGPTGAGKTTTLRLVAGLELPDEGRVVIGGRDVTRLPPAERDVAFVFQQYSLYPHLSVFDNLAFPLRSPTRRVPEDAIRAKVAETAAMLRIEAKLGNRATNLSGGEMQRVAIGRALVRRPAIYLMDEPLSSLDAKLRADLRLELKRIQVELGATFLYVTHDQIEAMTMATKVGVIEAGRVAQVGTPREIYEDPKNAYVAARLGQPTINLMPRRLLPDLPAPAWAETVGARTEHLRIDRSSDAVARGRVAWIEHLGDQNHLHITIDAHDIVTLVDPDAGLTVGDEVGVNLVRPLFFDAQGERIAS
jgi:multiple sugar transport system ATP-binding protein